VWIVLDIVFVVQTFSSTENRTVFLCGECWETVYELIEANCGRTWRRRVLAESEELIERIVLVAGLHG
jgi:hypothetical protein